MDEQNRRKPGVPPVPRGDGSRGGRALSTEEELVRGQLEKIRGMDPEMTDLSAIISSEAGEEFRRYVNMGLDFVDAYTLAARERLQALRDRQAAEAGADRARAAGKGHLSATSARGRGEAGIPRAELSIIRALLPDVTDEEIRRYYQADRKRFGGR